jgi:chemotaxis signal transduction protein
MKTEEKTQENLEEVEFLVFEAMGSLMGIDSEHIARIVGLREAEDEGADVSWLHEKISFGSNNVDYSDPRVIFIKDNGFPRGVIIDRPRDIVTVPVRRIRPLPKLVERCAGTRPLWGAMVLDEGVVLLADFYKLIDNTLEN